MALKSEALGLIQHLLDAVSKLPHEKESDWVESEGAAKAAGVDAIDLKKVLRRPRIKRMLEDARIGCSFRSKFLYVYKKPGFGPGHAVVADGDEEAAAAKKIAADDWTLDSDYYYMPEISKDIDLALDAGMNIFSVGPAGSGKSSMLKRIFEARGSTPAVISFHGEVSVFDLVGGKDLVNGATVWTDGILPLCMRKGVPLIIDEADATPPDVQFILHPVLMGEPLLLTRNGAEYVNPEPGFCIVATGNTVGRGDDSGLYVGTNVLNEAYLDRYGMVFDHWYMPPEAEVRVLVKRTGVHKRMAEKMVKVAEAAREAMQADKLSSTFSTRKLLDWAKLTQRGMQIGKAFLYTCIAKVSIEDREAVAGWGRATFGGSLGIDPKDYSK